MSKFLKISSKKEFLISNIGPFGFGGSGASESTDSELLECDSLVLYYVLKRLKTRIKLSDSLISDSLIVTH